MDELRLVRRDDRSLIVANDSGDEFRLIVDDAVLSELRHLSRRDRETPRLSPRDIQAQIRSGKSQAQVAQALGVDEADIERYAEPVLAERRYILERAHAVAVRTDAADEANEQFGAVIAERLLGLGADTSEWDSWRDEEDGWMVGLEFISHDVAHRAVWSFDHRKGTLSPVNPDATTLSKLGDVGDRLIPKLRAVDNVERSGRFDSGAFDTAQLQAEDDDAAQEQAAGAEATPEAAAPSDPDSEYERRREIDQRAINSGERPHEDLSQTADLLDALRRRRGERDRDRGAAHPSEAAAEEPQHTDPGTAPRRLSIWQGAGVTNEPAPAPAPSAGEAPATGERADEGTPQAQPEAQEREAPERSSRKGRASIPSWDDILFGTRSDEDPA
ncbi:septation protein SepH [Leucobacter massiliensis]|uniref:DUF3071 domain-containing protein n=1 Tax=Leucobacter massiliensis TaxID=1686285 RepID=A0A2S9QRE2_9MICO|nr:septation protein SepH [Leucobacter massiliensis]PRI12150.1 hypothetical protein B4915_03595 [Leucobacter massiliensis]